MKNSFNFKQLIKAGSILLVGIFLGWFLFGGSSPNGAETTDMEQHVEEAHTDEEGNIVYTCSMHPQVRQNEPGDCPICGMELIPTNNGGSDAGSGDDPYTTTMTQAAMKLAQVQTVEVTRTVAVKKSRMPGKVMIDERRLSIIPAHFPGRIEKLYLDYTGAYVEKGDPIASVYSPELVTAQKELLEAYKNRESNPQLYQATRKKFINWEISPKIIDQILERGEAQENFDIHSHQNGYVTKRHVAVGDHIHFGKPIFEIANLSTVWIEFEAYENDLAGISRGDEVEFTVGAYPGETFRAKVTYIDPILDDQRRTATVRAEASNLNLKLKPNMLAKGVVSSELNGGEPQLQIPASAVLWTGERSLVYVQKPNTEQPSFQAREVMLGQQTGDSYVIKEGLEEGEQVVVKGNFMIDSAAQLADKRSMMNQTPGQNQGRTPGGHNHGGEPMDSGQKQEVETSQSAIEPSEIPATFQEKLGTLTEAYTDISSALANDDLGKAATALENFEQALSTVDMNLIQNQQQMLWMQQLKELNSVVKSLKGVEELSRFRNQFASLSDVLTEAVIQFGVDQTLHLHYCPMAQDQKGAYWLSGNSEIVNPYMGQEMPTCGTQKEVLQSKSK
ncbi:efflux RND transporter periplasmic adaptor subunit [Aliifodinibius sp. S!AR15-10]|uniref:efflux RND transporter periplasmic adaptor subunit n=1 Tax=Aliifodinibius sp. S!AR15-10 TaxID=2950437 RepID=UPI00285FBD57|nr:efflux RND transporter periplasmic adaptor subunit [Aliifodinibius sp. S!AR15-10]MDR8391210.1 efflux RND transporter periplasmic adaptor subunit [Aliifodinibius sp. S!AR15-10]